MNKLLLIEDDNSLGYILRRILIPHKAVDCLTNHGVVLLKNLLKHQLIISFKAG